MAFLSGASASQALLFSAIAYLAPLLLGWWLFGTRAAAGGRIVRTPVRQALWLALLLVYAGIQMLVGGVWDAVKHVETGKVPGGADFLWAPHIMLYMGFLIAFGVALAGVAILAGQGRDQGVPDPRRWVRQNPYLGAVILAGLYSTLSVPGDAVWHQLYGIDLSAWTPPHVMLALANLAVTLSAFGLLTEVRGRIKRQGWINAIGVFTLAVAINATLLVGTLEWELPGPKPLVVLARPIWTYPLVFGAVCFLMLALARIALPRWGATAVSLTAMLLRVVVVLGLGATGHVTPAMPLVTILGALLLDVVPWERIPTAFGRCLAMSAAYSAGYLALSAPILLTRADLATFTGRDLALAFIASTIVNMVLLPLARLIGKGMAPATAKVPTANVTAQTT